jgi:hypothetical protein
MELDLNIFAKGTFFEQMEDDLCLYSQWKTTSFFLENERQYKLFSSIKVDLTILPI